MQEFQRSLPMMLYRTLDAVLPTYRQIFAEFELTEQQWRVLRVLWEEDGQSLLAIAAATLLPPPSLVGIIDRLTRDKLVKRRRSNKDRRVVHVCLSADGRALEKRVQPRVEQANRALMARLSQRQWDELYAAMDAVIAANTKANGNENGD